MLGFTDKGLIEQLAGKPETEAQLRRKGLIDADQERLPEHNQSAREPILAAFETSFGNNSAEYVGLTMHRVRRIVDVRDFAKLVDMARESVEGFLRRLGKEEGIGHRTFSHYVQAIDSFCNGGVEAHRLNANPRRGLQQLNADMRLG